MVRQPYKTYAWSSGFTLIPSSLFPFCQISITSEWTTKNVLRIITLTYLKTTLLFKLKTIKVLFFKKGKLLRSLLCIVQNLQYFPQGYLEKNTVVFFNDSLIVLKQLTCNHTFVGRTV